MPSCPAEFAVNVLQFWSSLDKFTMLLQQFFKLQLAAEQENASEELQLRVCVPTTVVGTFIIT